MSIDNKDLKNSIQVSGKTLDEAIDSAVKQLEVDSRDDLEIEVISEGSKGIFGLFGAKEFVISASLKINHSMVVRNFLEDIFQSINITGNIDITEDDDTVNVVITGDEVGILIGRRGESLDSLQQITNIVANKTLPYKRVLLDIENYRAKREESLKFYAKKMAKKASMQRRVIRLEPMNPFERKIVHSTLHDSEYVETHSEGQEPRRRVIITPLNKRR